MAVKVVELPPKGNCLLAMEDVKRGGNVLSEAPLFVASPRDHPEVLAILMRFHEEVPFGVGHVRCHYAALCTYLSAPALIYDKIMLKGAPREEKMRTTITEVSAILLHMQRSDFYFRGEVLPSCREKIDLSSEVFQRLVMSWEWNGFNGYEHPEDLLIYDNISTAAHSCDPNCETTVLYSLFRADSADSADGSPSPVPEACESTMPSRTLKKGDRFQPKYSGLAFRALRDIKAGDELTYSYCLSVDDLAKDLMHRRKQLNHHGWSFTCQCQRCLSEVEEFNVEQRERSSLTAAELQELDGIDFLGLFEEE